MQTRDAESIDDPLNGNDRKDTGIMESLKRRDQSQMGRFRSDKSVSLSGRWRTYSDLVILAARSAGFADASTCTAALVFALLLMLNPPDVDREGMTGWEFFSIFFKRLRRTVGVRRRAKEKRGKRKGNEHGKRGREKERERERERERESGKRVSVKELERNSESCCSVKQVTERESRASLRNGGGGL